MTDTAPSDRHAHANVLRFIAGIVAEYEVEDDNDDPEHAWKEMRQLAHPSATFTEWRNLVDTRARQMGVIAGRIDPTDVLTTWDNYASLDTAREMALSLCESDVESATYHLLAGPAAVPCLFCRTMMPSPADWHPTRQCGEHADLLPLLATPEVTP